MIKMNFLALSSLSKILLIASALLTLASFSNAQSFDPDYQITRISGNSMLPTLQSGDTATVYKAYPYKKLRVGDVVIIESERGYNVIHRIVRRYRGGTWVTQGDNNAREDREVLSKKNFAGLALVDQSIGRYQNYLASIEKAPAKIDQVAMADKSATLSRLNRLRNL